MVLPLMSKNLRKGMMIELTERQKFLLEHLIYNRMAYLTKTGLQDICTSDDKEMVLKEYDELSSELGLASKRISGLMP